MVARANVAVDVFILLLVIIDGSVINLKVNRYDDQSKRILGYPEDSLLNFTELSAKYGFASEQHTVTTEDGYILTIFRIRRRCNQFKRPPVILMHGLIQSSDAWVDAGPNAGLAYLIAGACYDLWVGNQRGNYYSRRHLQFDPDRDPQFWQFSFDEIGTYDIPATIDYVLKYTAEEKLSYIGFSQGAGTFFIMCSERPGYCDKVNIVIALAPATRLKHTKSVMFRTVVESVNKLEEVLFSMGLHELFSKSAFVQETLAYLCRVKKVSKAVCGTVIGLLDSFHPGSISDETLQILIGHVPAGTSTHNLAKYGQSTRSETFQKFDYGRVRNLEVYGSEQPPEYSATATTAPVCVIYGRNDHIVDPKDVLWFVNELPDVLETYAIADPLWNHLDMSYSQHAGKMLFPKIHQYLMKYNI